MAENGLLGVLALLVAGYSLLTEERKLDYRLRMSLVDFTIASILVMGLAVIIYSPVLISAGVEPHPWRWGFNENIASFSLLLLIIIFFSFKALGQRVPRSRINHLNYVLEKLVREREFSSLKFLLFKYQDQIFEIVNKPPWFVRAHHKIRPVHDLIGAHGNRKKSNFNQPRFFELRQRFARIFPINSSTQQRVKVSVSRILRSKPFARDLVNTHPKLAARATVADFPERDEYTKIIFEELIQNNESPLYMEMADNQSSSYTGERFINADNVLLSFYFTDINVAKEAAVFKPVGDCICEFILMQKGRNNNYNQYSSDFLEGGGLASCPIFVATEFFGIMVSRSIFNDHDDHMWVMYLLYFIQDILKNLDRDEDVHHEFPSRFDCLTYHIFSTCASLAGTARYRQCEGDRYADYRDSPEGWSAWTLGQILRELLLTDKIAQRQKVSFVQSAVRLLNELDGCERKAFSRWILSGCVQRHAYAEADQETLDVLRDAYRQIDHVLKRDDSTIKTLLNV